MFMLDGGLVHGMPGLMPGSVHIRGNQNVDAVQETTGELFSALKGDYNGAFTTISVDRDGNLINYDVVALLDGMLTELKKMNLQLSMITDHEISGSDIR